MTTQELQTEWTYLYEERLGILCGGDTPTPEQIKIATDEADAAIKELRKP